MPETTLLETHGLIITDKRITTGTGVHRVSALLSTVTGVGVRTAWPVAFRTAGQLTAVAWGINLAVAVISPASLVTVGGWVSVLWILSALAALLMPPSWLVATTTSGDWLVLAKEEVRFAKLLPQVEAIVFGGERGPANPSAGAGE